MHFFTGFVEWLLAVVDHWEVIVVTGAIPFAIDLLEKLVDWKMPKKIYVAGVCLGLFLAMFAAWKDERKVSDDCKELLSQRDKEIADLKASPEFVISPPQTGISYNSKADVTVVFIVVGVTNQGAPSIAGNWRLQLDSPRVHGIFRFSQLPKSVVLPNMRTNMADEDAIYEKTMGTPMPKGGAATGWAVFQIPGKAASEDLEGGTARMRLICTDYLGKDHFSPEFHPENNPTSPLYFPGLKGGFKPRKK